jgi:hypothetical protein
MADRPSSSWNEASNSGLPPMLAMLEALDDASLAEVDRATRLTLNPPPSPAERRVKELGFLASLLQQLPPRQSFGFPVLKRREYDKLRPASATSSAVLVRRYGSWNAACYAAYSLQPDGRRLGPGVPWPSSRGRPGVRQYTREEVLGALRQCQHELGRRPSERVFARWTREKRRDARKRGARVRLPGPNVVYRYYPSACGGWRQALFEAGCQDA